MKKLLYICSPCRGHDGNYEHNITMAQEYCKLVMTTMPEYIPIAPHVYFTQFLDDTNENQRTLGMDAGIELLSRCDGMLVFYMKRPSAGMRRELKYAAEHDIPILDAAEIFRGFDLLPADMEASAPAAMPASMDGTAAAPKINVPGIGIDITSPTAAPSAKDIQEDILAAFQKSAPAASGYLRSAT